MKESYGALFDVAVKEDFERSISFSEEKTSHRPPGKAYDKRSWLLPKPWILWPKKSMFTSLINNVNDFIKLMKNKCKQS
jgi:hypothetical protein